MEWVTEIFRAVLIAGLPLMALTFAVIWWALYRGRVKGESVGELQKSIASLAARQKSDRKKKKETSKEQKAKLEGDQDVLGLTADLQELDNDLKGADEPGEKLDPVLEKWFSFGGGFYGLVAFYTWLVIEWDDAWGFLADLPGIVFSFDIGSLISLVISFFIESLMNFIAAIAWPVYWMGIAGNPWLWIVVAYGGYWLGIKAAQQVTGKRWMDESPDLGGMITRSDDEPS